MVAIFTGTHGMESSDVAGIFSQSIKQFHCTTSLMKQKPAAGVNHRDTGLIGSALGFLRGSVG